MPKNPNNSETVVESVEDIATQPMSRIEKLKSLAKDPFVIVTAASIVALVVGAVVANNSTTPIEIPEGSEDI